MRVAVVLGLMMLAESRCACDRLAAVCAGRAAGQLQMFTFETLLFFALVLIVSIRDSAWLAVALLVDAAVGMTIGLIGLGELRPLSLSQMALIVGFSAVCSLTVNDVIKARLIRADRTLR